MELHGTLLLTWVDVNPTWMSDHVHNKVWDKITNPFPNFNSLNFEVLESVSEFILHS